MSEPLISIVIDGAGRVHAPGEELCGAFQIDAVDPAEMQAVELSVLWYTEGKGDEDLGVHHFERFTTDAAGDKALNELRYFRTRLPYSPLSYDGAIVKIRWCVRVRIFLSKGREFVAQTRFQLGNVAMSATVGEMPIDLTSVAERPAELLWMGRTAAPIQPIVIGPVRMRRVVAGRTRSS